MKHVFLVLPLVVVGATNSVVLAQHAGHGGGGSPPPMSAPAVQTGKVKGRIVEIQQNAITVETQQKGRLVKLTYLIDGQTTTKGSPVVGGEVVLKYQGGLGMEKATSIEMQKPKR